MANYVPCSYSSGKYDLNLPLAALAANSHILVRIL